MFFGNDSEAFEAVDARTGTSLWHFNTGQSMHASPMSYAVSGKQYVAIVYGAGGGGIWPLFYGEYLKKNQKGGGLMVFTVE